MIPEVGTSLAEPGSMIVGNGKPIAMVDCLESLLLLLEVNDCKLSSRLLAQIAKPSTSEWFVDDYTMSLLRGDLQLLIDCTRPLDRLVFVNNQLIRVERTLKIVHELEFFGASLYKYKEKQRGHEAASFTCPYSGPLFSV